MGTSVPLDPPELGLSAAHSTLLVNSWDDSEGLLCSLSWRRQHIHPKKAPTLRLRWEISFVCIFLTLRGASRMSLLP